MAYNSHMNTSEVHNNRNVQTGKIDSPNPAVLVKELQTITNASAQEKNEKAETKRQEETFSTKQEEQSSVLEFQQLLIDEFNQLGNGIDRYVWMQREIEGQIRTMLHLVDAQHDKDSQVDRMVASVARDIAEQTISEDPQGNIARTGYNKQFDIEIEQLSESYKRRLVEINAELERAEAEGNAGKKAQIVHEAIRNVLEHVLSFIHSTHEEMIRILRSQRDVIISEINRFQELQYFKTEEVWQNTTYRLLSEYSQKALITLETIIGKLKIQAEGEERQIASLAKESVLLTRTLTEEQE